MQVNPRLPGYRMWGHFRSQPISFAVSWHASRPHTARAIGRSVNHGHRYAPCAANLGAPAPNPAGRILRMFCGRLVRINQSRLRHWRTVFRASVRHSSGLVVPEITERHAGKLGAVRRPSPPRESQRCGARRVASLVHPTWAAPLYAAIQRISLCFGVSGGRTQVWSGRPRRSSRGSPRRSSGHERFSILQWGCATSFIRHSSTEVVAVTPVTIQPNRLACRAMTNCPAEVGR